MNRQESMFIFKLTRKAQRIYRYIKWSLFKKGRSYSEKWQDIWVIKHVYNYKREGFFLDLAASDGIQGSNTYLLERKYGWKGICIEANGGFYKLLKKNRSCICDNSCIDDKSGRVKFIERGYLGGIVDNNVDNKPWLVEEMIKNGEHKVVWKNTITLAGLLEKYNVPATIDYFSLDVEGAEERILKNFPFNKYKFLSMTIERPTDGLKDILVKNGYIQINKADKFTGTDSFYVHKEIINTHPNYKKLSCQKK